MAATVEQIHLATVHLPDWHPRVDDGVAEVYGFVVRHPDGVILVDTGVGAGNEFIDDVYRPTVRPLHAALHGAGVDERDVECIVNTHLHFDHCGQNDALSTPPIWVCDAEVEAAQEAFYTVPEWATIEPERRRRARDGDQIAVGVTLLETPGHTPGHQSVAVDTAEGLALIVGQCCYCRSDFEAGIVDTGDVTSADAADADRAADASRSLERLRSLRPACLYFSHEAYER